MKRMTLWLSWASAYFSAIIYTKVLERPRWFCLVLTVIITVGYICGLFIDEKE